MWIKAHRKVDGVAELINPAHIVRVYVNLDADPDTVVVFTNGEKVAYCENIRHFTTGGRRIPDWPNL